MTQTEQTTLSRVLVSRIVEASGEVLLKRERWSDYHPTAVGAELYTGDLLRPAPGAIVRIQCVNGKDIVGLPEGEISSVVTYCPPQAVIVSRPQGKMISPRGTINYRIPYIISPRRTSLLNDKPTLRWNAVPDATSYTACVRGPKKAIWQTEVSGTEVVYTGDPPLESGVDYLLIVNADTGASSQEEELPGTRKFRLLDETDARQVRSDIEQLAQKELAGEARVLSLVYLYIGYDLRAEAIEKLELLVGDESQTAAVYRLLGDLYQQVELSFQAEERYLKAVELAKKAGDREGEAVAAAGLGTIYDVLGNPSEAIGWLSQGRDGSANLGDAERVKELEEQLRQLRQLNN